MSNIFIKLWELIIKFLNNPKTKETLKKILWLLITQVVEAIKNKDNEKNTDFA